MNCDQCTIAEANPRSGLVNSFCSDCLARDLAHSPTYAKALAFRTITSEYQLELMRIANPGESVEDVHKRVRRWADVHVGLPA